MVSAPDIPGHKVGGILGTGGFSTVYRAWQMAVGREVAVKVDNRVLLTERDRRRFVREVTAAGRLSGHPHVIDVYDAGTLADGRPYLVMELCPAGSLNDLLHRQGPLSPAQVRDIGVRISDALAAAHAAGILHRDIKPANILINRYGMVGLSDFGLASIMAAGGEQSATRDALTPAYASPEAFRSQEPTTAADIYSLAATLYTLLAGRPPRFPADERSPGIATIMSLHDQPVGDVPGAPPGLLAVLRHGLATDPAQRPASAVSFRDDLVAVDLRAPGQPAAHPQGARAAAAVPPPTAAPPAGPSAAGTPTLAGPPTAGPPIARPPTAAGLPQPTPPATTPGRRPGAHRAGTSGDSGGSSHWAGPPGGSGGSSPRASLGPSAPTSPAQGPADPFGGMNAGDAGGDITGRYHLAAGGAEWGWPDGGQADPPRAGQTQAAQTRADRTRAGRPRRSLLAVALVGVLVVVVGGVVIGTHVFWHGRAAPGGGAGHSGGGASGVPGVFGVATVTKGCPAAAVAAASARCTRSPECWAGLVEISGSVTARSLPCARAHIWETFAIAILPSDVRTFDQAIVQADPAVQAVCSTRVLLLSRLSRAHRIPVKKWTIQVLPPDEAAYNGGARAYRCVATVIGATALHGSRFGR